MTARQGRILYASLCAVAIASVLAIVYATCSTETDFDRCVARGEKYFREIGSWPNLSDGRSAHGVAIDRCDRTADAFPTAR